MNRWVRHRRHSRDSTARICAAIEALESRVLLAHFAVIGDYSSDVATSPTRDVANLVKSWNPDLVATVGDNNYPDGAASTIDDNIGQWYHQFISPYKGSYGGGASTNEFFPTIGNHDYDSDDGSGYAPYLNYFTLPGNERYYTVTDGNVELFMVNSESHEPDGTSSTSTQGKWLQSQLASSTAQWKIVLFHHPAYSSGSIGSNSYMQWPFQAWGASAVIAGHDHDYERIIKNGFPYFVDGLGGESIVGWGSTVSGSQVRYNGDYGAMLIDSSSTSLNFQFVNRSGQVIDSYALGATSISKPSAPSGVLASVEASTEAKITWTDTSPTLTSSFEIARSSDGGSTYSVIGNTLAGVVTYIDSGLAAGGTYLYRIVASNSAGNSAPSASSSVTLPSGSTTWISDMTWVSSTNGWGPVERDMSVGGQNAGDGNTITLNGVTYLKGLGAHANSSIVINLNKQYTTFISDIGVDDETGAGTVDFQVFADGTKIYDSGVMTQTSATKSINVDVSSVTQLNLVVSDAGDGINYDHADWADAHLQSSASSPPPLAPSGLIATAISPTQINITWVDVLNESSYRVERSTDDVNFTAIGTTAANVTSYSDTTVSGDVLYYYRVIASNAAGDSPPSNVDFARPAQPPSAPTNLVANAVSTGEIDLSWISNDTNGEESFKIERSPDGVNNWTLVSTVPEVTSYQDTGLNANTQYFYRVLATNTAGDSPPSNVVFATTQSATSAPFTYIAAGSVWKYLDNGSNQGTAWRSVSFNDSAWKSGPAQLGYGDGDEATVVSYGSNPNKKYVTTYFRRSFNVTDPAAVSGLTLGLIRDDGAVVYLNGTEVYRNNMPSGTISYNTLASVAIGGADESTWYWSAVSSSLLVSDTNVIAVEIHQSDLTSSDISFDFQLSATVALPVTPGNLTANAVSGTEIDLAWTGVANETGYGIERSIDGVNFSALTSVGADVTSYADTSVSGAGTFYYRVYASNEVGNSGDSIVASATPLQPPAAPGNLTATAAGTTQIHLEWNDTAGESGFMIERSADGLSGWTAAGSVAAGVLSFDDSGLSPATEYFYRVYATSVAGNSLDSNVADATTTALPPAAPDGLLAAAISSSTIHLNWSEHSTNESGFVIERSLDGSTDWTVITTTPANATGYDDTGLIAATTYYYRVRATSDVGDSEESAVASATTLSSLPAPWVDADVGTSAVAGGAGYSAAAGGTFTLNGSGTNIGDAADGFHFAYVPMTGDCAIIAQVATLQNTDPAAQAGVMIRESLAPDSREAALVITPAGGLSFIRRATAGGGAENTLVIGSAAPYYVKLVRTGTIFTAYQSQDGMTWTMVGSSTIAMGAKIYVGLAVCSHNGGASLAKATFTAVSCKALPPPVYSLSAPSALTAAAASSTQINLKWIDTVTNETGFSIERSTNGSDFVEIAVVAAGTTTCSDSSLTAGVMYYYRIRAFNASGYSSYSGPASATTSAAVVQTEVAAVVPDVKAKMPTARVRLNRPGHFLGN